MYSLEQYLVNIHSSKTQILVHTLHPTESMSFFLPLDYQAEIALEQTKDIQAHSA
ncbi:uncharacterized protein PHALS_02092 [Plasmopara halstedii]|uniref:Uncharacterized protein n=1 Tax=Plasmopara halstedii TaxID=4781 RepID=A0A0P1AVT0_PLAHL|nr:uncharacterized protein PHALS_02092 [Plasmopara halstedii]CEG45820.1 hypothetical protein PHALS_02092 [Plasmopara halstedii]|eukprot:XP_024582189.1 hypothetical protein PHALS_02092 [Plasmopara halstedii]